MNIIMTTIIVVAIMDIVRLLELAYVAIPVKYNVVTNVGS